MKKGFYLNEGTTKPERVAGNDRDKNQKSSSLVRRLNGGKRSNRYNISPLGKSK